MLSLHLIDPNDYTVLDDDQPIGRVRLARERSPSVLAVDRHGEHSRPVVRRRQEHRRGQGFKAPRIAFKDRVGAEALAKAHAAMSYANRPDRDRR